jgi:hypothetical protein
MTKKLLFVTTLLLVLVLVAFAADVTGKWTYEQQGRNGNQTVTLNLKQDGGKLTGTMDGGRGGPVEISNGKVEGDDVSFDVVREFNGNSMTMKYAGKLAGEELKLKIEGGRGPAREVTAKRGGTQ